MSEHLTFDEMDNFLESETMDNETRKMSYKINEHISKCKECYDQYKALLELDDQLDFLRLSDFCEEQYELIEKILSEGEAPLLENENEDIPAPDTAIKIITLPKLITEDLSIEDDVYDFNSEHSIELSSMGDEAHSRTMTLTDNEETIDNRDTFEPDSDNAKHLQI